MEVPVKDATRPCVSGRLSVSKVVRNSIENKRVACAFETTLPVTLAQRSDFKQVTLIKQRQIIAGWHFASSLLVLEPRPPCPELELFSCRTASVILSVFFE